MDCECVLFRIPTSDVKIHVKKNKCKTGKLSCFLYFLMRHRHH